MTTKIKQIPEDFIVEEKSIMQKQQSGNHLYFYLKKTNYDTSKALQRIAQALHIPIKKIGFAGNKDKKAITTQLCSIRGISEQRLKGLKLKDIEIKIFGKGSSPIVLGDLEGNFFKITLRNLTAMPKIKKEFINYFGEQRFSKNNAEIGKLLVQKKFDKATNLMQHETIKAHLKNHPKDHIGALRRLQKNVLRLYVHSYQSLLWNEMVSECDQLPESFPIIGFDTSLEGPAGKTIESILKKEHINLRDFIFPQMKELSSPGADRKTKVKVQHLKAGKIEEDGLNKGKKKLILEFFLPKGSYATVYIKELHP